jgi:hypothetical protein
MTMVDEFEPLNNMFFFGEDRLRDIADIIANSEKRLTRIAAASKVVIIVLGAFAATHGAASTIFGEGAVSVLVVYTVVGLIIAAVGGSETAFRFESRSSGLRLLTAEVNSTVWRLRSKWHAKVMAVKGDDRIHAAESLIDEQIEYLPEVQKQAAELGVNILSEVRTFQRERPTRTTRGQDQP